MVVVKRGHRGHETKLKTKISLFHTGDSIIPNELSTNQHTC